MSFNFFDSDKLKYQINNISSNSPSKDNDSNSNKSVLQEQNIISGYNNKSFNSIQNNYSNINKPELKFFNKIFGQNNKLKENGDSNGQGYSGVKPNSQRKEKIKQQQQKQDRIMNQNVDLDNLLLKNSSKNNNQKINSSHKKDQNKISAQNNKLLNSLKNNDLNTNNLILKEDSNSKQNNKFIEAGDFSKKCNTNSKKKTQRNEEIDNFQFYYLEQNEENQKIGNIFKNKYTIVDLMYDNNINKFVVTKQIKGTNKQLEKEYKILKQLKGNNITLDVISEMQDENKFQQIAGKTDLKYIKQKGRLFYYLDLIFFILLKKQQRMHELGIAHSDIKPSNIVLSDINEPYFIDFGGAIDLKNENEYQNYLNENTYLFNLKKYFIKYDPENKISEHKIFTSRQEIELCDRTQLSLTFLSLFCEDEIQLKLFKNKQYNELIQSLFDKVKNQNSESRYYQEMENRKLAISYISKILNQADESINVIENQIRHALIIDEISLQFSLNISNDIIFQKGKYKVYRIDKYSVLQIYFLHKLNCYIKLNPKKAYIIPIPEVKEYQLISKVYKIDEYFKNQINGNQESSNKDLMKIYEYLKAYKTKEVKILIKTKVNLKLFFQRISNLKSLETIEFYYYKSIVKLTKILCQELSNFKVLNVQILKDTVVYLLLNVLNQQKLDVYVKYNEIFKTNIEKYYLAVNYKFKVKIKEIEYLRKSQVSQTFFMKEYFKLINLYSLVKQMNINNYPRSILFERSNIKDLMSLTDEFPICSKHKTLTNNLYYFIQNIFIQQQSDIRKCSQCQQLISKIKQILSLQVENFSIEILKFQYNKQIITIKIYNYVFEQINTWIEIKNMIETDKDCYIELKLINCSFSQQVAQILKQIFSKYGDKKIYEFQNEQYQNEYKNLQQQIFIEQNEQQLIQKGFKIIFISYNTLDIDKIEKMYTQSKQFEIPDLSGLKIFNNQQNQQDFFLYHQFNNKYTKRNINILIKDIKNKKQYCDINLYHQRFGFYLKYYNNLEINCDCINTQVLNDFYELYQIIYNSYYILQQNSQTYFSLQKLNIQQKILYSCYNITQKISYKTLDHTLQDIFSFLEIDKNQNSKDKSNLQFDNHLLISYSIKFKGNLLKQNNDIIDEIRKTYAKNNLKDIFNQFLKDSITNSVFTRFIFENKSSLLQFDKIFINNKEYTFKVCFEEIEKFFPQNKVYNFQNLKLTGQILYEIYEGISTQQIENKIYFNLTRNKIKYNEFKQFIDKVQNGELINQLIFKIEIISTQVKNQLISDLNEMFEINVNDRFIIAQTKEQENKSRRIKIYIDFDESELNEQQPNLLENYIQICYGEDVPNQQLKIEPCENIEESKNQQQDILIDFDNHQNQEQEQQLLNQTELKEYLELKN